MSGDLLTDSTREYILEVFDIGDRPVQSDSQVVVIDRTKGAKHDKPRDRATFFSRVRGAIASCLGVRKRDPERLRREWCELRASR